MDEVEEARRWREMIYKINVRHLIPFLQSHNSITPLQQSTASLSTPPLPTNHSNKPTSHDHPPTFKMQLTTIFAAVMAAASTAYAAPAAEADAAAAKSMMSGGSWTIENFKRTCGPKGKLCTYDYGINANGQVQHCNYEVGGSPASRASYNNVKCGPYTVSSNWSGQFGEGQGFQTLAIVNGKQIIYPAYTDNQLASMQAVKPDQSYTPQSLP